MQTLIFDDSMALLLRVSTVWRPLTAFGRPSEALVPPSWALKTALERQVGILKRFEPPSWAPKGALGRQVTLLGAQKAMGLIGTQPRISGTQRFFLILLVLHMTRSALSIFAKQILFCNTQ